MSQLEQQKPLAGITLSGLAQVQKPHDLCTCEHMLPKSRSHRAARPWDSWQNIRLSPERSLLEQLAIRVVSVPCSPTALLVTPGYLDDQTT